MSQILIAEDEPRIASFVAKGLRSAGYSPTVVGTAQEAVDLAVSGDFDLLILDLGLPDQDGFTALRRIRKLQVTIPVIILTARSSVDDTVAGLEGGADDYMAKPFQFEELLARVRIRLRDQVEQPGGVLTAGELALDLRTRVVQVDARERGLASRAVALLEAVVREPLQL